MVDTKSIIQKKKKGVTFQTFGVEHYELEENTVQNEKKYVKVPNIIINKTCHMGHFSWDMRRHTEIQ
jgi:glutaredoxin